MTTLTGSTTSTTVSAAPRRWLYWLSLLIALVGLLDTAYLAYSKLAHVETFCPKDSSIFKCDLVQASAYSTLAGIPIAYLGFFGYVLVMAVLLLDGRVPFFTERGPLILFGITLIGFLYSAYLTSIEAFVLQAWCMYCLVSAIGMTLLFILSGVRAWRKQFPPLVNAEEAE